jgi:hypothetical protein
LTFREDTALAWNVEGVGSTLARLDISRYDRFFVLRGKSE